MVYGSSRIGQYPRNVDTYEKILNEGRSGVAQGVHLHFELWEKNTKGVKTHTDPNKYFNRFFKILSGYAPAN